jgi:hypothetical protein
VRRPGRRREEKAGEVRRRQEKGGVGKRREGKGGVCRREDKGRVCRSVQECPEGRYGRDLRRRRRTEEQKTGIETLSPEGHGGVGRGTHGGCVFHHMYVVCMCVCTCVDVSVFMYNT